MSRPSVWLLSGIVLGSLLSQTDFATAAEPAAKEALFYVGTYTQNTGSQGIYRCKLNLSTGEITILGATGGVENPSFLAIHPNRKFLYAVGEVGNMNGKPTGGVAAFAIDPKDGSLTLLNQQEAGGGAPCHLVVDATGKNVLVANYTGGNVACLPIKSDGQLGEMTSHVQHTGSSIKPNQKAPHAHSINLDAANRFAMVADLGIDKVLIYRFDAEQGKLLPHDAHAALTPGSGPRHFAWHPSGKFAYVINEIALTVTAFAYDAEQGTLTTLQTIDTLPDADRNQAGLSTAEVVAHPSGKFLYGSNRGHDTIVVYSIDPATGKLTHVENVSTQGKTPRNFCLDPTGQFLLAENQGSGNIVVFRIDQNTGRLSPTGKTAEVPAPVCIRFMPISE